MAMQMWMLPEWLRAGWVLAFGAVAALHLRHAAVMAGQRRYWHVGHVLMGAGMGYMYLPHSVHVLPQPISAVAGSAGFAVAAVVAVGCAVWFRLRAGVTNPLWVLAVAEMGVMSYMFLPVSMQPALLSHGLALYLAGQGLLWALGVWDRYLVERQLDHAVADTPRNRPASAGAAVSVLDRAAAPLRASLVVMAAGMAYMLLAM